MSTSRTSPKIKVTAVKSYPPPEPTSPTKHVHVMDWDAVHNPDQDPSDPTDVAAHNTDKKLASIHAIHGKARHVGGRWHSTFAHVEHDTVATRSEAAG